jgi:5-methyltetrahydrofolate--homocysteine methyltransferase
MEIIGEKINGTRSQVGAAVVGRDVAFIQDLARQQVEGGATYIDLNAGTGKTEPEDLAWLVQTVQAAVDVPLCLDSANPAALRSALALCEQIPLVNSISGEKNRMEGVLPIVAEMGCPVVALAADDNGISKDVDVRLAIVKRIISQTRAAGVPDNRVYFDPLVLPLAGFAESGAVSLEAMRRVKSNFPDAKLCVGLSNLSYSMPARSLINRVFLAFAVEAGLDAALLDPNDNDLMQELTAAEVILGRDPYCRRYTTAYRQAKFGFPGMAKPATGSG